MQIRLLHPFVCTVCVSLAAAQTHKHATLRNQSSKIRLQAGKQQCWQNSGRRRNDFMPVSSERREQTKSGRRVRLKLAAVYTGLCLSNVTGAAQVSVEQRLQIKHWYKTLADIQGPNVVTVISRAFCLPFLMAAFSEAYHIFQLRYCVCVVIL